jgi:hypothetical protein
MLLTGSQKPHYGRNGCSKLTGVPLDKMHAKWIPGPGSYGRNDAGDAAHDAALISKLVGRPVRLQYMRADATAWDPKGPAVVYRARAGLDAQGNVVAYDFFAKGFSRQDVIQTENDPKDTLAGQMTGYAPKPEIIFQTPAEKYEFAKQGAVAWECRRVRCLGAVGGGGGGGGARNRPLSNGALSRPRSVQRTHFARRIDLSTR